MRSVHRNFLAWLAATCAIVLVVAACSSPREPRQRWDRRPRPAPTAWKPQVAPLPVPERTPNPFASFDPLASPATPSPPTLAPTPSRRGMHDRTRDPLSWSISSRTPRSVAASMRLVDRARAELAGGTAEGAFELLDQALELDPGSVPAHVERARAAMLVGSTHGARADLEKALALQPKGAWLAEVVAVGGEVYETEGREDAAVVAYRRALVIHPPNRTAREALSRLLAR